MKLLSHGPEPCASANSAISAYNNCNALYFTTISPESQGFFRKNPYFLKINEKFIYSQKVNLGLYFNCLHLNFNTFQHRGTDSKNLLCKILAHLKRLHTVFVGNCA